MVENVSRETIHFYVMFVIPRILLEQNSRGIQLDRPRIAQAIRAMTALRWGA
jgi:hypothetical protein